MKTALTLAAGLAAGLALASAAQAQYAAPYPGQAAPYPAGPPPAARGYGADTTVVYPATAGAERGNWTLKRRENWLNDKINQAHDEHAIGNQEADRAHHMLDRLRDDENHMRDHHDGQLTDNETVNLESRLDSLTAEIQQMHENSWQRPW
jgi:hypothetical protein